MKKIVIASAVALTSLYAGLASANNGVYVTGEVGSSIVNMHDTKVDYSNGNESNSSKFKNKRDGVFGGGLAVGYDFNDQYQVPVRVEIAGHFRDNAKEDQSFTDANGNSESIKNKVRMDTYMVNGYYDFHNTSAFTPYLTAGVGLSHLVHKASDDNGAGMSANTNNFAWGVGAGVKYEVTSNISVDASYRYIDGGKITNGGNKNWGSTTDSLNVSTKAASNDLMMGVTYKF